MKKSELNVATIGCGRISEKHLASYQTEDVGGRLVAVCDLDAEKAAEKGGKYGVPWYTDYHEMIKAHPEIEVLDVMTPSGMHAKHVLDLAPYGKHIITEKPMALRVEDCDAMIKACEKHGCRLFVVKQNRYNRAVVAARKALEENRFGRMVMGTIRVRWRRDQAYYNQADWRGTWELDGGVMSQQATHHLDLLQWFMGPIESLQCRTATRLMDIEVEDTAVAILKFKSGALGAFEATVATRPEDLEGSMSLLGENGSVIIGGPAVNRVDYWKFIEQREEDLEIQQMFSQEVPNVYGHGHLPYLRAAMSALLENAPGPVEGASGMTNINILTALYESAARGGEPVTLETPVTKARIGRKAVLGNPRQE
ncbi:MAG: Gfo/Idh/MocA family oxidoreductase [Kiritimatiellae bacterium]|nr:Gfo/Idh/MocA family oxidoreductase [Kiritimatiellia bacterium]